MAEIERIATTDRIEQLSIYVQLKPHIIAVRGEGPARFTITGPEELIARLEIEEERGRAIMVTEADDAPGYTIKWGQAARRLSSAKQVVSKVVGSGTELTIGCLAGDINLGQPRGISASMVNSATALDLAGETNGLKIKIVAPGPFSFRS